MTDALAYWQGQCCQSESDENGISLFPYIHAMYGLIRQTAAHDVLMIGCGAGNLGTMLHKSGYRVTIVDIDPNSFVVAKQYFNFPDDAKCVVDDGFQYLANTNRKYDAIIVDAYQYGNMAKQFNSHEFFIIATSKLFRSGHVYINTLLNDDFDRKLIEMNDLLQKYFLHVGRCDNNFWFGRNVVVVCGDKCDFQSPALLLEPQMMVNKIRKELKKMKFYKSLF
ncbi:MAG: spermidine synthase [Acidiphilium sp.]